MVDKIISICIPTYNRRVDLKDLLDNIIEELNIDNLWDDVEVCISDNASTDDTKEMVAVYLSQYSNFKYHLNEKNLGFARNMLQAVSLAEGEYCWLFGSDDQFEPHGIVSAIGYIRQYKNIGGITVDFQGYDITLRVQIPSKFGLRKTFVGRTAREIYGLSGISYGYMSVQIVNRKKWNEVIKKFKVANYCNAYVHVYIIAQIIKDDPYWLFLAEKLVKGRGGNDSTLIKTIEGYYKRLRVEYDYYDIIMDVFGKYSIVSFLNLDHFCGGFIFGGLQRIRLNGMSICPLFPEITGHFWTCPSYYYKVLPIFILPKFVIKFIHLIKKCIKNLFGRH